MYDVLVYVLYYCFFFFLGIVIYIGYDSKLMLNFILVLLKRLYVEKVINN